MEQATWESYSPEELVKQMSVNSWNPNKAPDEVMNQHIQKSLEETNTARSLVGHKLGIPYGSKPSQVFDEYGTELKEDSLILFWIHGGYWQQGTKDIAGHMAPLLVSRGVRNIVVEYTLAPNATIAQIQEEILQALQKVGELFPKAKIIVGGHSAGGQLAAMLLHTNATDPALSERIIGLVLSSGVFDLRPLVATPLNTALGLTLETAAASSPLICKEINHNFLGGKGTKLQILILVGEYESPEFKRQAQAYHILLQPLIPATKLVTIEKEDHFTIIETLSVKESLAGIELGKFLDGFS